MLIKQWLRRSPKLRFLFQRGYYAGLYFTERYLLGSRVQEMLWRARTVSEECTDSQSHPHRSFLLRRLDRFAPFESVLEVGCNFGPNLMLLARTYPGVRLYGMDISAKAIKVAKTVLTKEEADGNVRLFAGCADDLSRFSDKSLDVVLTDAVLMYVGPDKITRAITEFARVARKALVLNEWNLFEPRSAERAHWHYSHWVHDFKSLLGEVPGVKAVRVERLPRGLWNSGSGWERYGALIEVEL